MLVRLGDGVIKRFQLEDGLMVHAPHPSMADLDDADAVSLSMSGLQIRRNLFYTRRGYISERCASPAFPPSPSYLMYEQCKRKERVGTLYDEYEEGL